jgi:hypothetical protein
MKCPAPGPLQRSARARPAPPDGDVGFVQRRDQLAHVCRLDLVIGRQCDDRLARGTLEAGHERGRFAEAAGEIDDDNLLAVVHEFVQAGSHQRMRPVENENTLVTQPQGLQPELVVGV